MNEETPIEETFSTSVPPASDLSALTCDKCGEIFANPLGLRVHRQRKHGNPAAMAKWTRNIAKAQKAPKYKCEKCGDVFQSPQQLGAHTRNVHNKVKAAKASIKRMARDIQKKDTTRKAQAPYQCKICGDRFETGQAIALHTYHAHTPKAKVRATQRTAALTRWANYKAKAKAELEAEAQQAQQAQEDISPKPILPSQTKEARRAYYERHREKVAQAKAQEAVKQEAAKQNGGRAEDAPAVACPNYCPNCGFGLAAVSVAITLPNR